MTVGDVLTHPAGAVASFAPVGVLDVLTKPPGAIAAYAPPVAGNFVLTIQPSGLAAYSALPANDPSSIFGANLVLWLRGDSLVDAGGGFVQTWTDKATFGNSPSAPALVNRPTINASALGGRAAANFAAGASMRLVKSAGTNLALTNCSIFAVWKRADNVSNFRCFAGMGTFAPEWGTNAGRPGFYAAGAQFPATITVAPNTYCFQEVTKPGGGLVHIYVNAVENTPAPTDVGWPAATSTTITIGSGSNGSGDDLGLGEIAEIILINRAATAPEAASVRSYVNAYYGTSF